MAQDLGQTASEYEQAFLAVVRESFEKHDYWREAEGIRMEEVRLEGSYPETQLVEVFRTVRAHKTRHGAANPACRFGIRWPIWPADYTDQHEEGFFHEIYFGEFLGTDPSAYLPVRGSRPCDPTRINWLS